MDQLLYCIITLLNLFTTVTVSCNDSELKSLLDLRHSKSGSSIVTSLESQTFTNKRQNFSKTYKLCRTNQQTIVVYYYKTINYYLILVLVPKSENYYCNTIIL